MKEIIIIGASNDRNKYGNKAVRAYRKAGWNVFPINPKEETIEGVKAYHEILDVPGTVKLASLYVSPSIGEGLVEKLKMKGVKEVYVNPGSESTRLLKELNKAGIRPIQACSIVEIGQDPSLL